MARHKNFFAAYLTPAGTPGIVLRESTAANRLLSAALCRLNTRRDWWGTTLPNALEIGCNFVPDGALTDVRIEQLRSVAADALQPLLDANKAQTITVVATRTTRGDSAAFNFTMTLSDRQQPIGFQIDLAS